MTKSDYRQMARPRPQPSPVSDGLAIPGLLLRKLVTIHSHYEGRGERIGGVAATDVDTVIFEATVTDGARTFHVKLRMSAGGIEEYGRQEDITI